MAAVDLEGRNGSSHDRARAAGATPARRRLFRIGVLIVAVSVLVGVPWLISRPPRGADTALSAAAQLADGLAEADVHAVRRIMNPDLPDRTARVEAILAAVNGGPFVADSIAVRPIEMAPAFAMAELHGRVGGRDIVLEVQLDRRQNGRWYVGSLAKRPR